MVKPLKFHISMRPEFSTLCATLPNGLVGDWLVGLVEGAFGGEGLPCLACGGGSAFFGFGAA